MARSLVASGSLSGIDHETFGPNETMHEPVFARVVLTQEDVPQNFATLSKGWGGECRLEVRLTARILTGTKSIRVDVNGKLFEGDDESTGDLEDEKTESTVVPKGGVVIPFSMTLYSRGFGGGDSGTISLSFVNTIVEE